MRRAGGNCSVVFSVFGSRTKEAEEDGKEGKEEEGRRRQKTASTGTHHQLHPVLAHGPRDFGQDVAREHLARPAPRGVEVHEHGHGRSLDHVVERRVRFLRRVSHARIPVTRRIVGYIFSRRGAGTAEARVRRPRFAARTGALGTTEAQQRDAIALGNGREPRSRGRVGTEARVEK